MSNEKVKDILEAFPEEPETRKIREIDPKAGVIEDLLRDHGEVLIRTASGQVLELHLGDDYSLNDDFLSVGLVDREVFIAYDQIESITCHMAHLE